MTYAIIKFGSKEHKLVKGDIFTVDSMQKYINVGDEYDFKSVLMIHDGEKIQVGQPIVEGAKVVAKVKSHQKGKKIHIMKFKRRKSYLKRQGFRPLETTLEVLDIHH